MAIGVSLQELWNAWNIRSLLILSLCIQIILAFSSPLRRQTTNTFTIVVVWSTYLLADWVPIYVFGLISNTVRTSSVTPPEVSQDILALWVSFLLIHMGGPYTITAYSLEDNALWLRHLMILVIKLCISGYIFTKSFPGNDLSAPTILVLVMGVIKYGERTRALFLASLDNLKSSVSRRSIAKLPGDVRLHDNYFFQRFVGMIVDIMPSYSELKESREYFLKKDADAGEVLKVISGELSLMYEVLYTKIKAVYSKWGIFCRCTILINMVSALVLFCLSKKKGVDAVDVKITYGLWVGAFVIDMNRRWMLFKSDYVDQTPEELGHLFNWLNALFRPIDYLSYKLGETILCCLRIEIKFWSKTMGSFDLLEYCFHKHCPRRKSNTGKFIDFIIQKVGLPEKLDKMKYTRHNKFDKDLWKFIFGRLKSRPSVLDEEVKAREVHESRGELFLYESGCGELMHYVKDFEFDKGFLTWHIATEICYNIDQDGNDEDRKFSKVLSDYMMYLLTQRSKMMSPIAGIGHLRYSDTHDETNQKVAELGAENYEEFCMKVLEDKTKPEPAHETKGGSKSVLHEACRLAQVLRKNSKKWEVILGVWVEMLSYAASHCRADSHARALNKGGELISHVWLLMAHLGIGPHCPKQEESSPDVATRIDGVYSTRNLTWYECTAQRQIMNLIIKDDFMRL